MGNREQDSKEGPFRAETVQGEPWEVAGWRLTPVARLISFGRAKATIGTKETGGWGAGVVRITPVAVRAESAGEVRQIAIRDQTAEMVRALCGLAVAMTLFLAWLRLWAGKRRRPAGDTAGTAAG